VKQILFFGFREGEFWLGAVLCSPKPILYSSVNF
jgi:hypothetical protein